MFVVYGGGDGDNQLCGSGCYQGHINSRAIVPVAIQPSQSDEGAIKRNNQDTLGWQYMRPTLYGRHYWSGAKSPPMANT